MMNCLILIMAMSDLLITSYNVYNDLDAFSDSFYDEAELISEAKCQLINTGELEDMNLSKGMATVSPVDNGYYVTYNGLCIFLEVKDRMISDYTLK